MNYPLISEYIEAIRSAEDNFDKLSNLRPVLDGNGNPIMSSGNFAVVFKMRDESTGRLFAVKCFIKEQEGRGERYAKITEELESEYKNKLESISKKYEDEFAEYKSSLEKKVQNKENFSELLEKLLSN